MTQPGTHGSYPGRVLVLALDTATEVVTVGLLEVPAAGGPATVLAARVRPGARQHGEQLMPAVLEVCAAAGHQLADVDAVVCGAGPGPFTGLRVGLVSAAGLGDALGVPVYGVCSLDAVAAVALDVAGGGVGGSALDVAGGGVGGSAAGGVGEPLLVVSDARRREVYWAAYDETGRRVAGPAVDTPSALAERVTELGVRRVAGPVAAEHAELLGLAEYPAAGAALAPSPAGLVAAAGADLRTGADPAPLEPYYLRRPDAVPPAARKRVSLG
jgi:tRNA threonylcarbamoyl adenosine modification protein YeaZ